MTKKLLLFIVLQCLFMNVQKTLAQCAFTATVPYLESFNNIVYTNQLPTCWISSNANACLTFTSSQNSNTTPHMGNQFAAFANVAGTNYFLTNGVYLNTCVNYSVNIWYLPGVNAANNFSNISIMMGSNQSTLGLNTLAAASITNTSVYANLSTTFSVASSGIYYFAIRSVCNGSNGAAYLSWDDFSIEAPTALNVSPITVQATPSVICAGNSATLIAAGVQSYTWNNGSNTNSIVVSPTATGTYSVIGTNTNNGCVYASANATVFVPVPSFTLSPATSSVCIGKTVSVIAFGTGTYLWSSGTNSAVANLSPSVSTVYTVVGTNQFGCSTTRTAQVMVLPLPTLTVNISNSIVCAGDEVTVTASGANDYSWTTISNPHYGNNNPIIQTVDAAETFSIVGTDQNGCSSSVSKNVQLNACTGLLENTRRTKLTVFPNPVQDVLEICGLETKATIQLCDLTGAVLYSYDAGEPNITLDLRPFAKGMYSLCIKSESEIIQLKIVKN